MAIKYRLIWTRAGERHEGLLKFAKKEGIEKLARTLNIRFPTRFYRVEEVQEVETVKSEVKLLCLN